MGRNSPTSGDAVAVTGEPKAGAIRLEDLPPARIAAALRQYEELVAVMAATNNTLLARLLALEDITNAHVDVLNEWSAVNNQLHAAHALELERLTATLN